MYSKLEESTNLFSGTQISEALESLKQADVRLHVSIQKFLSVLQTQDASAAQFQLWQRLERARIAGSGDTSASGPQTSIINREHPDDLLGHAEQQFDVDRNGNAVRSLAAVVLRRPHVEARPGGLSPRRPPHRRKAG